MLKKNEVTRGIFQDIPASIPLDCAHDCRLLVRVIKISFVLNRRTFSELYHPDTYQNNFLAELQERK